jgi:hypothetical protein
VTSADLLDEAAAELYTADPDGFIERRRELAGRAREAGQAAAARQIAALRKPTRSAWVVNRLTRSDPDALTQLTDLGRDLRAAERAKDGAAMRDLAQRRRQLITALVRQALTAAGQPAASAAMREELTGTFAAAIADPEVAGQLQQGTLVRAVFRAAFGSEQPVLAVVPSSPDGKQRGKARPGTAKPGKPKRRKVGETSPPPDETEPEGTEPGAAGTDGAGPASTRQDRAAAAEQRRAEARAAEEQRRAEARAARERRRAEVRAKAERAVADADQAVAAAESDQMEQQLAIRRLERELTNARRKLRAAGAEARRAEAAQRRARQALDRLDS